MTPTLAIIGLIGLAALDLLLGFLTALKNHQTTLQQLPDWLKNTVLPYVLPVIGFWLPQSLQAGGTFNATALTVAVYGAAVTVTPKIAQDVVQKFLAFFSSPAVQIPPVAPPVNPVLPQN